MHEVYNEKKDRGGNGSDFVFLDGEGTRGGAILIYRRAAKGRRTN